MNILEKAADIVKERWPKGRGWKAFAITVAVIGIIGLILWVLVKVIKALTAGGFRNKDLYIPGKFINRGLYIPRVRR